MPLGIILSAPFIDFTLKKVVDLPVQEIATVLGVSIAFFLSWRLSKKKLHLGRIARQMRPWNFALIILTMFVFLHIFQASNVADLIASIPLAPATLCVVAGFILGFATGRVLLPASIILPVYLTVNPLSALTFATIYSSIFFGYVISPVHPCVAVSLEYFNVSLKKFFKLLIVPTLIVFLATLLISFFISS
jgi:hypothetical protein